LKLKLARDSVRENCLLSRHFKAVEFHSLYAFFRNWNHYFMIKSRKIRISIPAEYT